MVLAVLEARLGLSLGRQDVFLNIAGGLKVREPAADLAVAAALISSTTGVAVPKRTAVFGEIGLSGEVRPVGQSEIRIKEAAKLGFHRVLAPRRNAEAATSVATVTGIAALDDLFALLGEGGGERLSLSS